MVFALKAWLGRILIQTRTAPLRNQDESTSALRPAELAYLVAGDDLLHAVLVMAVDLTQRAVKSTLFGAGPPEILDYEAKMWEISKEFVKKSAERKIEPYLPSNVVNNPFKYFKKISSLYSLILNLIRRFSKEVARDPRHIRKYFSAAGLIRLVADFFTSGYQDAVSAELTCHLTEKQLVVANERCTKFSRAFLWLGALSGALAVLATLTVAPFPVAMVISLLALLSAISVHLTMFLRDLIPLYPELAQLLRQLNRKDWRITLARAILSLLETLSWTMIFGVFVLWVVLGGITLRLVFGAFVPEDLCILITLTFTLIICFDSIARAFAVQNKHVLTALGQKRLHQARQRISKVSPSAALLDMLQSDQYEALFSEIVAIYGIAPLIILA
jgi:hypothetical protein